MNSKVGKMKVWAAQIRAPFLVLSILLTLVGGTAAKSYGTFDSLIFLLTVMGVTLSHVAVNLFNEYFDNRSGIDKKTRRTPFSGGSGNLQQGFTTPKSVIITAWVTLLTAFGIGIYLALISTWWVLAIMAIGGLTAVFYTTFLTKWALGELFSGLTLGSLVIIGTFIVQENTLPVSVIWLSVSPGILTSLLLLLNEFPDVEADRAGGRKHLVIRLGWKKAAWLYTAAMAAQYLVLGIGALMHIFPMSIMLTWLTLPLACFAINRTIRYGDKWEKMVPALGANVGVVLGVNLLIAIAYFL